MKTILRMLVIVGVSAVLGLAANAIRTKDHVKLGRVYFKTAQGTGEGRIGDPGARGPAFETGNRQKTGGEPQPGEAPQSHPFQTLSTEQARELLDQARELPGFVIFLDARPDGEYREGHIPAAYQLDYYNITNLPPEQLDQVLDAIQVAHQVVVYCNGGDCEDSLLLCTELRDTYFIPEEKLYLYEGGMEAWREAELPVEKGERRELGEGER